MYKYDIVKNWIKGKAQDSLKSGKIPSVREIASQLSVSVATVLRALTDLEQEKVLQCRQGAGLIALHPDSIEATGLISDETSQKKILFASPEYVIEGVFRTSVLIEQNLSRYGATSVSYRIKPTTTLDEIIEFSENSSYTFSGIIIHGFTDKITTESLTRFGQLPCPVAFLDIPRLHFSTQPENCRIFLSDPASGAKLAADYFASHGHTRIGYLRNEPYSDYLKNQIDAFGQALHARGINFNREHVFSKPIHFWEDSMAAAQTIIKENIDKLRRMRITALFVSSANGACAIVDSLRQAGIAVPADISIIGEGDVGFAKYMSPSITVVHPDILKNAATVVDFIFGATHPAPITLFNLSLTERKSVASLQKKEKNSH